MKHILKTNNWNAVIIIRTMVGSVFLSEGIQKFIFPNENGVGRFIKLGVFLPEITAPFVGALEITCGILILIGFLSRAAALKLMINMIFAWYYSKLPVLLNDGFWEMAHGARNDWAMFMGSLFIFITGGGRWSVDKSIEIKK